MCSYYFRNNIESSYGDNVTQLKRNYSQEEKELIDELVQERFKLRSITRAQTIDLDDQIDTKQDELHQEGMIYLIFHAVNCSLFHSIRNSNYVLVLAMCRILAIVAMHAYLHQGLIKPPKAARGNATPIPRL